jgi:hypothetical protein
MTATIKKRSGGRARGRTWAALLFLGLLSAVSCASEGGGESTGGETHFLVRCEPGSNVCGSELVCICGVCTKACDTTSACADLPGAACRMDGVEECGESFCDRECFQDSDCAVVSAVHRCESGFCRAGSAPPVGGAGTGNVGTGGAGGTGGTGGVGGTGGSTAGEPSVPEGGAPGAGGADGICSPGEVTSEEVVVLGDSFFATTGPVAAVLSELAREDGALAEGESYRDYAKLTANSLALAGDGIEEQYAAAKLDGPVELVVMNGGGADALAALCDDATACPLLPAAADALRELFGVMSADGVRAVVYAFYPDPADSVVRARIDVLRTLIEAECAASPVPCHWIDLRETFAGKYEEFVLDGLNPTVAGARATAESIWGVMRSCVAGP